MEQLTEEQRVLAQPLHRLDEHRTEAHLDERLHGATRLVNLRALAPQLVELLLRGDEVGAVDRVRLEPRRHALEGGGGAHQRVLWRRRRESVEELLVDSSDHFPVREDRRLLLLGQRLLRAQRLQALLAEEREVGHAAAQRQHVR